MNILNVETVPLRYQKEKIRGLFSQQLETERAAVGRETAFEVSPEAFIELENYDWHGNFRELLNFATRIAVECASDARVTAEKVERILQERYQQSAFAGGAARSNFVTVIFDLQADDLDDIYIKAAAPVIQRILEQNGGNLRRSASKLGVNHMTLTRILKKCQLLRPIAKAIWS